ncbi:MAG TPA: cytochrome P450 [Solirubrobacterales bacterium]|nr:cytochrome P450 [Solirubrobacterales bacterium]
MPDWSAWPFEAEDPYPGYRTAREEAAVRWDQGVGAHLVLSHEHAATALRGGEWSSDPRNSPQLLAALEEVDDLGVWGRQTLLTSDPPAHTRLRSAVSRFFTPRAVRGIQDRVAAIVETALAPVLEGEPTELMAELAYPIPLAVIAELFDVGLEGAEVLGAETPVLARGLELDPAAEENAEVAAAALRVMLFLVPIVARRKVEPGDDLLSALIHPPAGGAALADEEIITMCLLLLAAGHETTANLIGNGAVALFERPGQLDWLARHPAHALQAVDELLRFESPVQVASRIATVDMDLGGVEVAKGEQALVVIGAANRDPARHPDPDRLDLSREGVAHLAFGLGPHFCVGAGLARLEARETFVRLARSPLRPEPGTWSIRRDRSHMFRRLQSLDVDGDSILRPISTP